MRAARWLFLEGTYVAGADMRRLGRIPQIALLRGCPPRRRSSGDCADGGAMFVVGNRSRDLLFLELRRSFLIEGVVATGHIWVGVVIVMVAVGRLVGLQEMDVLIVESSAAR